MGNILYRLFTTGSYKVDTVLPSTAPSMDIQVASNFERFLYYHEGESPERVSEIMKTFLETGDYHFESFNKDLFSASRADDVKIGELIKWLHGESGYVMDPHTACGFSELPEEGTRIVLSTAHPAKFPEVVEEVTGVHPTSPTLDKLKTIDPCSYRVEPNPDAVKQFIIGQL